jgi:hypothetical protein
VEHGSRLPGRKKEGAQRESARGAGPDHQQQVVWGHVEIREDMNPYPIGAKVIIRYNRLKR